MEYFIQQTSPPIVTLNPDMTATASPIKDIHFVDTYTFQLVGRLVEYGFAKSVPF